MEGASRLIGQQALCLTDGQRFLVTILNARGNFGRVDLLTQPVGGSGQRWRSLETITILHS